MVRATGSTVPQKKGAMWRLSLSSYQHGHRVASLRRFAATSGAKASQQRHQRRQCLRIKRWYTAAASPLPLRTR